MRPLVLGLAIALLAGCAEAPESPRMDAAYAGVDLGARARHEIANGNRTEVARLLELQLARIDRRVTDLTDAATAGRLGAIDRERLEILVRATGAARADLDTLSGADATTWRAQAEALSKRVESVSRGLDRIVVQPIRNI